MLSSAVGIFHIITVKGGNDQGMGDDPRLDERRDLQQGFQDDLILDKIKVHPVDAYLFTKDRTYEY